MVGLSLARSARTMTAVDSSRAAVFAARLAAVVNRVPVDVLHGDLFEPVGGRTFDVIVSNPPYLPTPEGARAPGSRAWDGGHDGRSILDRLCREAPAHLRPGGELFVVQSSLAGTEQTLTMLGDAGLRSSVAAVHLGPLGPQARSQAPHLRAIGVLPGAAVEDIVVVRARHGPG